MAYESIPDTDAYRIQQKPLRSTRVEFEPIGLTEHGRRCRVSYAGETLVEGRRNPIFDACRALLARGITGRLEVWRRGKTSADMQLDIERGAGLAIWESATQSLRAVPQMTTGSARPRHSAQRLQSGSLLRGCSHSAPRSGCQISQICGPETIRTQQRARRRPA
jgi:hypothetical protein